LNFPFYIARRYVFAKKSHNAINIIAGISILGITMGTLAFIVVLSVFNGFDAVVKSMFNSFYADFEVKPLEGKTLKLTDEILNQIRTVKGVAGVAEIVEENALILYGSRQMVATVRGVSDNYHRVTGMDTTIWDGAYQLWDREQPTAVVGRGIKYTLNMDPDFFDALRIMVPRRSDKMVLDPNRALNTKLIRPVGFFESQPEIELKYVIVPLKFARELFDYPTELTALEIHSLPTVSTHLLQKELQAVVGTQMVVKNRMQQNELLYKTMKSEKWAIFFILVFILLVASFNVVGTLSMLIIEKKKDIETLRHLGATLSTLKRTFLFEGLLISFIGALAGLAIGSAICFIQQEYGIVKLQGAESFVIDSYPVRIQLRDILLVLLSVSLIGYLASWYPIRFITRKYLRVNEYNN